MAATLISARQDVNAEPPAVRMNEALGGLLTYKLKGEDAVRPG